MSTHIGVNCHMQFLKNRTGLFDFLGDLDAMFNVFMDDAGGAREFKRLKPDRQIAHRAYNEGDHYYWKTMTPLQFYDKFAREGEGGVVIYCLNEPSASAKDLPYVAEFMAGVYDRFGMAGISVIGPNFGVGSPHESDATLRLLDPMWAALKRWQHVHYYGCHEYGTYRGMTYVGPTGTNNVKPWRIGRAAEFIVPYCRRVYGFTPRVVISEHGGDLSGYLLDDKFKSGWRSYGWSQVQYAAELIKADQEIYDWSWNIGQCIFSYGNSAGKWTSYDIEDAVTLKEKLIEYSRRQVPAPIPPPVLVPPLIDVARIVALLKTSQESVAEAQRLLKG